MADDGIFAGARKRGPPLAKKRRDLVPATADDFVVDSSSEDDSSSSSSEEEKVIAPPPPKRGKTAPPPVLDDIVELPKKPSNKYRNRGEAWNALFPEKKGMFPIGKYVVLGADKIEAKKDKTKEQIIQEFDTKLQAMSEEEKEAFKNMYNQANEAYNKEQALVSEATKVYKAKHATELARLKQMGPIVKQSQKQLAVMKKGMKRKDGAKVKEALDFNTKHAIAILATTQSKFIELGIQTMKILTQE